jgi:hypothetical protein
MCDGTRHSGWGSRERTTHTVLQMICATHDLLPCFTARRLPQIDFNVLRTIIIRLIQGESAEQVRHRRSSRRQRRTQIEQLM